MRHQRQVFFLLGICTLNAMAIYALYRLGTVIYSVERSTSIFEQGLIVLFFLTELFIILNAIGYFVNIFSSMYRYRRHELHYADVQEWPEVVVFIPMRNEPIDVIRKTFIACSYLEYPKRRIVAVDSSDDPAHRAKVRSTAEQYGVEYFMTPYPRHGAKAGALNEAMKVYRQPYIAVFDADYRPSRDFLKLLVPQMVRDQRLGFIQTPQFYGNHRYSPVSRISQIQQSIFYEYISEGKSVHNGMFLCGTNLIVRRAALDSVGGWDESSITEDFSTSIRMVAAGWDTRFYNFTTAFGEGPINLRQYMKQQYRWARGTFGSYFRNVKLFFNPMNHLGVWQRIEYTLSGVYFLVGVIWSILILMPVLYVFLRTPAYSSDPLLFSVAYAPYALLSVVFYMSTMRHRFFRLADLFKAQSLTFLTIPVYVQAFWDLLRSRQAVFETVDKQASPYEIPWDLLHVQLIFLALNIGATVYGFLTFADATNKPALASNLFWTIFHSAVLLYFLVVLYVASTKKNIRTRST